VPLLDALKTKQQPLEFILPREGRVKLHKGTKTATGIVNIQQNQRDEREMIVKRNVYAVALLQ
jgi:hypothetical protein